MDIKRIRFPGKPKVNIKKRRLGLGLSQVALAKMANVCVRTIVNAEDKGVHPNTEKRINQVLSEIETRRLLGRLDRQVELE